MGFLDGLLETKAKKKGDGPTGNADSIGRATGAITISSGQGLGNVGSWDADKAIRSGYERVIWIFRAVDAIAQNQASITIDLKKGLDRRGGEIIENDRLFRLLNFRPNTYESAWQFRYRLSSQILLSRRGAFIEIVPGRDKMPAELHLLPVGKTKPIPDPKTFLAGYEVTSSDNKTTILKPEQVIWVRAKPHPVDPYAQMTPLVAAGIEADTDYLARVFNRNFLANDGRPGMLVTVDPGVSQLGPKDMELLRQRFGGGASSAGVTTVIEGVGINAQDMSASPRDTQWDSLLTSSKERILMSFGVPESVMGNASGRTFDNADAERENFWLDTMVPHCDNLAFAMDALTGDINDDQVFGFRFDEVDVLQRMATRRREEWRTEVQAGLRTVDEYLEAVGREPWNRVETRIFMNSNGVFTGKNDEDSKAAKEINPQAPQPAGGAPGAMASGQVSAINRATSKWGNQIAARALSFGKDAYEANMETKNDKGKSKTQKVARRAKEQRTSKRPAAPETEKKDDQHDRDGEAFYEGVLESWDARMAVVVPERLNHVKARKGTRHWEGPQNGAVKALDAGYVVDTQTWLNDALRAIDGRLGRSYKAAVNQARREIRQLGVNAPDMPDHEVDANIAKIRAVAEKSIRAQMARVEAKVSKMEAEGLTLTAIDQQVRRMIGARSSWRKLLATNIATTAREQAKHDVNSKVSFMVPVWATSHDERVRDSHKALDGKKATNGVWVTPTGATLRFPGDPLAPPGETVNCRCWISWEPDYRRLG